MVSHLFGENLKHDLFLLSNKNIFKISLLFSDTNNIDEPY